MSTEHTYQIGDRVRMIGNGHVGKVVGSLGSSPLYPRRVLIESLVDEVRWYCLPAELSPVAPDPTADTAAEPEVPAGSLVVLRHVDGHLASAQKHMSDYGDYFLWSGCEWRWWASNGYAVIGVFEPGAVPVAVPSPEPPAQAPAAPLSLVEEAERDFPEQMRAAREEVRAQSGDHPPRTRPAPSLSQEPGETR